MKKCSRKIIEKSCCKTGYRWRQIALGFFILSIFALGWYFLSMVDLPFADWLKNLREESAKGLVVYFLLTVTAVIAAPLATMPLTPLAANFWGWQSVLIASVVAWQIGAIVNFLLAKKFGYQILQKFTDSKKVDRLIARFPRSEQFFTIFLLRMVIPVDILSYALGLTKVSFKIYFWATLFGILPFAFVFSYGGEFLDSWKIVPIIIGSGLFFFGVKKFVVK